MAQAPTDTDGRTEATSPGSQGSSLARRSESASLQTDKGATTIADTVPGYDAAGWVGIAAPARTPDEIVAKVNADMTALLRDPAIVREFHERATIPAPSTPAEFAAFIDKEMATWATVVPSTLSGVSVLM